MVFAVQADVMALFAAPKLGDALAAAAYHPTEAVVRKLWAQCENILDRSAEVDTRPETLAYSIPCPCYPHIAVMARLPYDSGCFVKPYQATQPAALALRLMRQQVRTWTT